VEVFYLTLFTASGTSSFTKFDLNRETVGYSCELTESRIASFEDIKRISNNKMLEVLIDFSSVYVGVLLSVLFAVYIAVYRGGILNLQSKSPPQSPLKRGNSVDMGVLAHKGGPKKVRERKGSAIVDKSSVPTAPRSRSRFLGASDLAVEVILRAKRANVFTEGANVHSLNDYRPKKILKTAEQIKLIRKFIRLFLLLH
jgi:hypothetical protein